MIRSILEINVSVFAVIITIFKARSLAPNMKFMDRLRIRECVSYAFHIINNCGRNILDKTRMHSVHIPKGRQKRAEFKRARICSRHWFIALLLYATAKLPTSSREFWQVCYGQQKFAYFAKHREDIFLRL